MNQPPTPTNCGADWLTRPTFGKRADWNSYLFMPFSPKLGERVHVYTPARFDNWVEVEWDPNIRRFNEFPPPVKIPFEGKLRQVVFDMACLDISNRIFLKRLVPTNTDSKQQEFESKIDVWATELEIEIDRVCVESFSNCQKTLANKKEFLHFIYASQDDPLRPTENQLLDQISRNPGVTIGQLEASFHDFDPTTVVAAIGMLLIDGKVQANLSSRRVDRNLAIVPT